MVTKPWVPRRTEIIHLNDVGGAGHEQTGDRFHLVLTGQGFNDKTSLVVCVAISTKQKGFPFEVALSGTGKPCWALTHQVFSADWRARLAFSKGLATNAEMADVEAKVRALLGL